MHVGGVDVFGLDAQSHYAGRDAAEDGEVLQEAKGKKEPLDGGVAARAGSDKRLCAKTCTPESDVR